MDVAGGLLWLFLLGVVPALPLLIFLKYLYIRRTLPTMSAHGDRLRSHSDQIRMAIMDGLEATVFCTCWALSIAAEVVTKANLLHAAAVCWALGSAVIFAFWRARRPLDRLLRRWIP